MRIRGSWDQVLAAACLVASACAPLPPPTKIDMPAQQFSVANVTLPSGLQVIVEDDASARVVASALVVSAGTADDPPGQEGMAHLVEHLTFRAHRPGQSSLSNWLALHGVGSWNAFTELDLTSYYLVGPPETLSAMIDAEIARMQSPLEGLDEETFQAERGVVVAELHTRDESGGFGEGRRALYSQLFSAEHPYSRSRGRPESLATITLEQARAWADLHYRPRNMTWVLAGGLDRAEAARLLEQRVPAQLRDPDPALHPGLLPSARPRSAASGPGGSPRDPRSRDSPHAGDWLEASADARPEGAGPGDAAFARRSAVARRGGHLLGRRHRLDERGLGAHARARARAGRQPRRGLEGDAEPVDGLLGRWSGDVAVVRRVAVRPDPGSRDRRAGPASRVRRPPGARARSAGTGDPSHRHISRHERGHWRADLPGPPGGRSQQHHRRWGPGGVVQAVRRGSGGRMERPRRGALGLCARAGPRRVPHRGPRPIRPRTPPRSG